MTTTEELLCLDGLRTGYGAAEAIHGLSLSVRRGEILFVLGANGAGKSTLLHCLAGRLPANGRILLAGEDIAETDTRQRLRLGVALCPEGRRLFPDMTVDENLRLGAHLRRDRAAVEKDLDELQVLWPWLDERRTQKAGTLSGGEQQLVAIGRALMARPRLLLLDEPTVGLSAAAIALVADLLRLQSRERGITILGTEQNVVFARELAHRVALLAGGKLRAVGQPAEVLPQDVSSSQLFGLEPPKESR